MRRSRCAYLLCVLSSAGVRVVVGPVVGKVSCSSARILLEVDTDALVTCHVPVLSTLSEEARELPQCQLFVRCIGGRPVVFHTSHLLPGRDYRFSFGGIDKQDVQTRSGGFRTPSLETSSSVHAVAVSGNNPCDLERCEANLRRDVKQLVGQKQALFVVHMGGQVVTERMFGQSCALLMRHASVTCKAPGWQEIEVQAMEILRSACRTQRNAMLECQFVLAHVPNLMIWSDMDVYPAFTTRGEFYIDHEKPTIQVYSLLYAITHVLDFSPQFFVHMRYSDGTPRTPRDSNGRPPVLTSGACQNGNPVDYVVTPNANTAQYASERERVVAKMATPTVAKYVKAHFNCSSLVGAELENQDDGCLGSHWEERVFEPEYISPVSIFRNIFSGLTLAYFEDSGWCKTNLSTAERLHFGANKGCSFASDKCIDKATQTSIAPDDYCTSASAESCSVDVMLRSARTLMTGKSIPSSYQYFLDATKGGNNDYADYCPLNIGYVYGDCANPSNLAMPPGTSLSILGETYCETCKCTSTTLRSADSSDWVVSGRRQTGCYAMACVPGTSTVEIAVASGATAVKAKCTTKGAQMKIAGFSGALTRPDPFTICSHLHGTS